MSTRRDGDPGSTPTWVQRHPLLTTLAVLFLIAAFFSRGSDDTPDPASTNSPSADETTTPTTPPAAKDRKPPRHKSTPTGSTSPTKPAPTKNNPSPSPERPVRFYAVTDVVDGDTVKVAWHGETTLRIIGIDTPETVDPSSPVECGGPRASALATQLLTGRSVHLVFDPSQGRLDRYGRTLAYIQAPGLGDFGLAMIRKAAAAEYTYNMAYARQAGYQAAEQHARALGRGLWGACGGPHVAPATRPAPIVPPTTSAAPAPLGSSCAPGYSPCVPPYPPDLDCADVGGPINVTGSDPHGLDGDGDGVACES